MKGTGASLIAHYGQSCTTIAKCWKVTRTDGQVFGFTDHDRALTIDGVTFSARTGFSAQAVQTLAGMAVDNLEVAGMFDSLEITEADIHSGRWDFARVELFEVNWADLSMGKAYQRVGWIGEVRPAGGTFVAELRGLLQKLAQSIGRTYQAACDADLGDARCGINLATFSRGTVAGTVVSVTSRRQFADAVNLTDAADWFTGGRVTWLTGANAGISAEVKAFAAGVVTLHLPMPHEIEVGDTFEITAGCDKSAATCTAKFVNIVNFRGFPHVPGLDALVSGA